MSEDSELYVVEAGGAIPDFVSEAESIYDYGRTIEPRSEQQPQFQQNDQQQQIPLQVRRGPNKKEGKQNRNTQSQQIQGQPFKRQIIFQYEDHDELEPIQSDQNNVEIATQNQFNQLNQFKREIKQEESNEHNRQYQRFEDNISQDQFPLQISKQYQERKKETQFQERIQKNALESEDSNNQIKKSNKIIQQELKYKKTGQQRRESKQKDKQKKPAQSNQNNNIQKKIRKLQEFTRHLLRKAPFMRLVRRTAQIICDQHHYDTPRFTYDAIVSLQEIMETTMVRLIEDAYLITTNSNRATLYGKDLTVLRRIRNAPWDTI